MNMACYTTHIWYMGCYKHSFPASDSSHDTYLQEPLISKTLLRLTVNTIIFMIWVISHVCNMLFLPSVA